MLECIYLDPRIHKCLDSLRRAGKKASLAADKAEEIIARLQTGGVIPDRVGTVTKHGEARIKGVMKYDLGSGYRFVTYKQGDDLYLLHVGTHDDCHRWIENNRELTVEQILERCIILPIWDVDDTSEAIEMDEDSQFIEIEEEYDPLDKVSQSELRVVFSGLVQS